MSLSMVSSRTHSSGEVSQAVSTHTPDGRRGYIAVEGRGANHFRVTHVAASPCGCPLWTNTSWSKC
ncbi:hypothetical protein AGABI2DRAFT_194219, partial [Agaricus bisporus var. bisporus H97]|uniref:hypothetical protein n=1 Tax=Agaricus bisporus var. bisporus (strain H97 / ATCC MYA-4626 / FGSC 10389) TaxID=936046 RepID=UPI00029F7344